MFLSPRKWKAQSSEYPKGCSAAVVVGKLIRLSPSQQTDIASFLFFLTISSSLITLRLD